MASSDIPETMKLLMLFLYLCDQTTSNSVSTSKSSSATSPSADQTLHQKLLSRRRGLIPNSRRRGDTFSQLYQKAQSKILWKQLLLKRILYAAAQGRSKATNLSSHMNKNSTQQFHDIGSTNKSLLIQNAEQESSLRRHKRWDYEENYDWENGGKDYVIPGEEKKETKFEKFAKSWQKHAIKVIFLFSFVCMLLCCCLAICKKFCDKVCETVCWHLRDYRDICLNRDPRFRSVRKMADEYGIELDYDQYTKIKKGYEEGFRSAGYEEHKDLSGR